SGNSLRGGPGRRYNRTRMSDFLAALRERVLILDGAMGTQIQAANLSLDEYWGKEGNSEVLNLSRPDVIANIHRGYFDAGAGLVDGGADAIIIETCQDMLQVKSAVAGAVHAFTQTGRKLPLIVQVTIETTGTMLLGTEIAAALTALEPYDVIDVVGVNCATGPVEMTEHVRFLCQSSKKFVSVLPNAGLPELRDGRSEERRVGKEG